MLGERGAGMDHPHYAWSPLSTRPALHWPGGAPVAVAVIVLLEHVEATRPGGQGQTSPSVGVPFPPDFNMPLVQREYGHRVGIFRVLDTLERRVIRPSIAMDAMTAEKYPSLVAHCVRRNAEILAHGLSASRQITAKMSEADERAYIGETLERLRAATGQVITGWYGPEQFESERTPRLLDEFGLQYVCDWPNDEQPYLMSTPRNIISLPTMYALDDASIFGSRSAHPDSYADSVKRAFQQLSTDGSKSGRLMVLVVRPWLIGQPHRIGMIERALSEVTRTGMAWTATTGEIAEAFRAIRNDQDGLLPTAPDKPGMHTANS